MSIKNFYQNNKHQMIRPLFSFIAISAGIVLTIFYSNCSGMKSVNLASKKDRSTLLSHIFGAQLDQFPDNDDRLVGKMSFANAEIKEGETTTLSWDLKWKYGGGMGYKIDSFNCTPGLFANTVDTSILNITGGYNILTEADEYQAKGEVKIEGVKASSAPYSCQINFQKIPADINNIPPIVPHISVSLQVNAKDATTVDPSKCEGDKLIQGYLERCDNIECVGWAFNHGQVSSNLKLVIKQSGLRTRTASVTTYTAVKRSDVDAHLAQQGCLNPSSLLSQFNVSKAQLEEALKAVPPVLNNSGNGRTFSIEAYVVTNNGEQKLIDKIDNYKPNNVGDDDPKVSGLSFVSGSYDVGVRGSASSLPENTKWCITNGSASCTPNLENMKDWVKTESVGSGRYNWKYEILGYQKEWCPGTFNVVVQAPGETALSANFNISYPNFSAATGGLKVSNVPPGEVGTLLGCFEYNQVYGSDNKPGSCGGKGSTAIIGKGWSYDASTHSASFEGDSSVFGGRHGTIYFTFNYKCGLSQTISQSF